MGTLTNKFSDMLPEERRQELDIAMKFWHLHKKCNPQAAQQYRRKIRLINEAEKAAFEEKEQ